MIFQDPTAPNARQTIYEAVAEGVRIQRVEGDEEQLVADALSRSGLPLPRASSPAIRTRSPAASASVVIAGAMVLNPGLLARTSRCPRSTHRCAARSSH